MKIKLTKTNLYLNHTVRVDYCGAYYLLNARGADAFGYNSGVYGWNYDVFQCDGFTICTGYNPVGNIKNYELVKKYNDKAKAIYNNHEMDRKERGKRLNTIYKSFCKAMNKYIYNLHNNI